MAKRTIVFADLSGSTGVFEALGNERATATVTALTDWIGSVCEAHAGRVVKTLGDGVLAVFARPADSIDAVVQMQRDHASRLRDWLTPMRMRLQVGVATGDVVEVDGDCYGDAVNVASRLSDLAGPDQIWATRDVIDDCERAPEGVRFLSLGGVSIRGKSGRTVLYRVEWQEDLQTVHLTEPALLHVGSPQAQTAGTQRIRLSWLDQCTEFSLIDLPVHLGREDDAQFPVKDPRVSRLHARIDWRSGTFTLTDLSSYGTWVRFGGPAAQVSLRRDHCVLLASGEIALGASFDDFTVPIVAFEIEHA